MEGFRYRLRDLLRKRIELLGLDHSCFHAIENETEERWRGSISAHQNVFPEGVPFTLNLNAEQAEGESSDYGEYRQQCLHSTSVIRPPALTSTSKRHSVWAQTCLQRSVRHPAHIRQVIL